MSAATGRAEAGAMARKRALLEERVEDLRYQHLVARGVLLKHVERLALDSFAHSLMRREIDALEAVTAALAVAERDFSGASS